MVGAVEDVDEVGHEAGIAGKAALGKVALRPVRVMIRFPYDI